MRPAKLLLSAWGPFGTQVEIDFEAVGSHGVFLIAGPTGAGKTSVFDGITFALFGEVSGSVRENDSIRSDFAPPSLETFVKLWFYHKGRAYEIKRNPRYERKKKRGEGYVSQPEHAELFCGSQLIRAGCREVSECIKNLLGMNGSQFKQLSMIAQGEFQKLLIAGSKERTQIFRTIFHTRLYETMEQILGASSKKLFGEVQELNQRIDEARASMELPPMEKELLLEELTAIGEAAVKRDKQVYAEKSERLSKVEGQLKEAALLAERKERLERVRESLKKAGEELSREEASYRQWKEREGLMAGYRSEISKAQSRIVQLQREETILSQYEKEKNRAEQFWKEAEEKKAALTHRNSRMEKLTDTIARYEEELNGFGNIEKEEALLAIQLIHGRKKLELLEEIIKKQTDLEREQAALEKRQSAYLLAEEQAEAKKLRYEHMEREYRRMTAGILAAELKDGIPCPVCGSLSHPKKAVAADGLVQEQEIKKEKACWEAFKERASVFHREAAMKNGEVNQLREQLAEKLLKAGLSEESQCLPESLEQKGSIAGIEQELKVLEQKKERKDWLFTVKKKACEELEQVQRERELVKEERQKALDEWNGASGAGEALLSGITLEFQDKSLLSACMAELEQEIEEKSRSMHVYEKRAEELALSLERRKAVKDGLEREEKELFDSMTESLVPGYVEPLALEEEKKALQKELEILHSHIAANEKAAASIKDKHKRKLGLEKKYGIVHDLELLVKGNNKKRLVFEQFVLAAYFEDILTAANLRLDPMTGGRYQFFRAGEAGDARKKDSLEIQVLDHYTGRRRSVKSLSGGETFKAALCLALGMSDVVQSYAGGIEVEVLFIDEGFGALDSESLTQALDALIGLAGNSRLIGVISHVDQLKERIDNQITITKTNTGSRI